MPTRRNNNRKNNKSGAGYLSPAEFFNPAARQPSSTNAAISSLPSSGWVRPPMASTLKGGKRNSKRRTGGFSPSIMGSFVSNVQSTVVPLVLAGLYGFFGTRKNSVAKPVNANRNKNNRR
jgi:hypothetical protein